MTTFDAIAHIRRESLNRSDALRFLMEHLGFSATYAGEIIAVVFADSPHQPAPKAAGDDVVP